MINKIFIFGASITKSMWWTWKDFLEIESNITAKDLSIKGAGNTYMLNSLIGQPLDENSLVVGMLTNVDKFDWYVEGARYHRLCDEKHAPIPVGDDSGFWCTGSWFPDAKQLYLEQFFSLDYFAAETIQQICALRYLGTKTNCKIEIFFDSPIWSYTEQDLNNMISHDHAMVPRNLLDLPLAKKWSGLLDHDEIDHWSSSLIGYCWDHALSWGSVYYKGHPPSSSHWHYYQAIMRPRLSKYLDLSPAANLDAKINKMDRLWKSC